LVDADGLEIVIWCGSPEAIGLPGCNVAVTGALALLKALGSRLRSVADVGNVMWLKRA